jgi:hypothetical protein
VSELDAAAFREVPTADLVLDEDNPRFFHLRHKNKGILTQEEIEQEIVTNDDDIPLLTKSIQKDGVKDPIWVVKTSGDKYVVVEGNRRAVVLKQLIKEGVKPPLGVRFDQVSAHVLPRDTPEVQLVLQKARLQSGKKAWGAFNEAALTYQLRQPPHLMAIEDIAVDLKIPISKVRERIDNYKLFVEYSKTTGDENPKRFAYFAECPPRVRDWFKDSSTNKESYFKLICPIEGNNKIRSVATRGGLRDFARVLEDPEALKVLLNEPSATVEDALEIAKDNDIKKAAPFIRRLAPLAMDLRSLDSAHLEKLKTEVKFKVDLKALRSACDEVLQKLER